MVTQMFGPYRLDGLLGTGGMGEVHRAYHVDQDRTVALKLLHADLGDDEEYRKRFLRESRVTARLTDPHVIPIHNWGEIDGRLYLDMRLVEGEDLADLVARGRLAPARAVAVVAQVARALDSAHRSGLVHRDVKPSNVLLATPEDGDVADFAYLVDFGIARSLSSDTTGAGITKAGTAVGTLDYMAPERFLEHPIDARVDVYALACVLHECLTGEKPFPVDGLPALMRAHLRSPPPRPSEHRIAAPVGLDDVVARGMAKDPEHRFPSAGALAAAARRALDGPVTRPAPSLPVAPAPSRPVAPAPSRPVAPAPSRPVAPHDPTVVPGRRPPDAPIHRAPAGRPPGPPVGPPAWPAPPAATPRQRASTARFVPPPVPTAQPPRWPTTPETRPAPNRSRWWLVAAAVLVVVAAVAAVFLLRPADPAVDPVDPATPAQRALLGTLPVGFGSVNCVPAPEREDTAVDAAVTCADGPADGPGSAVFLHYRSASAMEDAQTTEVLAQGLSPDGDIDVCAAGTPAAGPWSRGSATTGLLLCRTDAASGAVIEWTETDALARGLITRSDGDAALLYTWWTTAGFL